MAKITLDAGTNDDQTVEIDLKDPRLAAFLAWLIPGLGHLYQGRTGKGLMFSVCILGTFIYGLYIGNGHVVYASTADVFSRKFLNDRWQFVCQIGVGLPALPAIIQRARLRDHKPPLSFPLVGELMRPPYDSAPANDPNLLQSRDQSVPNDPSHLVLSPDELAKWNYDQGDNFDLGTVFTVIAGLLNVLVIFDAYGGPLVIAAPDEKTKADNIKKE